MNKHPYCGTMCFRDKHQELTTLCYCRLKSLPIINGLINSPIPFTTNDPMILIKRIKILNYRKKYLTLKGILNE